MTLTQEQQARKADLEAARIFSRDAEKAYHDLKRRCKCVIEPPQTQSVRCAICGDYKGWACDESPDGVCHYDSLNGKVELVNGEQADVPKGHDADGESDDWCIFCEEPDERK